MKTKEKSAVRSPITSWLWYCTTCEQHGTGSTREDAKLLGSAHENLAVRKASKNSPEDDMGVVALEWEKLTPCKIILLSPEDVLTEVVSDVWETW